MEYFAIKQDDRIIHTPVISYLSTIKNYRTAITGDISSLSAMSVGFVQSSIASIFPDFLDKQLFMVKDSIKEVFDLFIPNIEYKAICLLDNDRNFTEYYYLPSIEICECLVNENKFGQQRINENLYLDLKKISNQHIFIAKVRDFAFVACSLLVAEAIGRREIEHIRLFHLNTI